MMTQSSLCTGTWLLGFRGVGGRTVSSLRTEDDRDICCRVCNHKEKSRRLLSTTNTTGVIGCILSHVVGGASYPLDHRVCPLKEGRPPPTLGVVVCSKSVSPSWQNWRRPWQPLRTWSIQVRRRGWWLIRAKTSVTTPIPMS